MEIFSKVLIVNITRLKFNEKFKYKNMNLDTDKIKDY